MNIERLRKIIAYSKENKADFEEKIKDFYVQNELPVQLEMVNIPELAKSALQRKGYLALEIPFADCEIGALCYSGDAIGYIVLNTSLPKANVNFAICHELYHVYFQQGGFKSKVELINGYYEQDEELAANLFAGMFLMPEHSFRIMYRRFEKNTEGNQIKIIAQLMNYYQAPYMAVLIRCYELGLIENNHVSEDLFYMNMEEIKQAFQACWLDESILEATRRDDYDILKSVVARFGAEFTQDAYINQRTLDKVLKNMDRLYAEIKGE